MHEPIKASNVRLRPVRLWLLISAAMILLTLIVGGATRLTESGLSIVEWKPVTGVLPPLSQAEWQAEFAKYQAIPQYRDLNRGMSLDAFKTIYWWEWSHRLLARLTGAVFLLPLLFFLWRGAIPPGLRLRLWTIFGAGAALGAVGWWMVSSGLTQRVSVSQYRLAFHLTLATTIYAAILWTARQLADQSPSMAPARLRFGALALAALLLLQIYLGALVAGLDAGLVFNTWPLIDGALRAFVRKAVVHPTGVAQLVRKHAHRPVQSPYGRICNLGSRDVARLRCMAHPRGLEQCPDARRRDHLAGWAWDCDTAASGATTVGACAPGAGNSGI